MDLSNFVRRYLGYCLLSSLPNIGDLDEKERVPESGQAFAALLLPSSLPSLSERQSKRSVGREEEERRNIAVVLVGDPFKIFAHSLRQKKEKCTHVCVDPDKFCSCHAVLKYFFFRRGMN